MSVKKQSQISDANEELKVEFKRHMKRHESKWIIYWIVWIAILMYIVISELNTSNGLDVSIVFVPIAAGGVPVLVYYGYLYGKLRTKMVRQFLDANGFTKSEAPDIASREAQVFKYGHSKRVRDYYKSTVHNMEYFHYQYTTGSGKNSRQHVHDILKSHTRDVFGHVVISSKFSSPGTGMLSWRKLEMESPEFNKKFRVYVKKSKKGSDAYELLEPNVMHRLIELEIKGLVIELVGNEMYFIFHSLPSKRLQLDQILHLIELFDE